MNIDWTQKYVFVSWTYVDRYIRSLINSAIICLRARAYVRQKKQPDDIQRCISSSLTECIAV